MTEFPKRIDCGDFELVKPEATFDKAQEFFDVVTKNRDFLSQWLEWADYYSKPEDAYNYLKTIEPLNEPSYLIQVGGKVVGGHGFVGFDERFKTAEIGYWLAPNFGGHGYVTRGIKFIEDFAFGKCGMNRVQIRVDVNNLKSQAVAVRAGYKKEGVLRQSYIVRGAPCDVIMYSKLKAEWEKEKVK